MTNLEVAMWVIGGLAGIIIAALIRLRTEIHNIDVRVAKIETKLGLNGKSIT